MSLLNATFPNDSLCFFSVVFHSNVYIFLNFSVDLFFINYKRQCELVAVSVARQMNVNVLVLETNLKS